MIPPVDPAIRTAIEGVLDAHWPGEWRPARAGEVVPGGTEDRAVWRLDASPGEHGHEGVAFVWLSIDGNFPLSRMRVFAPGAVAPGAPSWPHVEDEGALCLGALPLEVQRHVRLAVGDAFAILGMDEGKRRAEFAREFVSYWDRRTGDLAAARSLVVPGGPGRPIVWAAFGKSYIFAEDKATLDQWMIQSGVKPLGVHRTRLIRLADAPSPDAYPATGADVFALDPLVRDLCLVRATVPVLFEVPTTNGAALVAAAIVPPAVPGLSKKRTHPVAAARRDVVFGTAPVTRMSVMRQDHAWVHGRDHNVAAAMLANATVGVVGCGALGSEVVRLLAAAGVGQFVLVDKDGLESANTTRHALGASWVGRGKATALATAIGMQFPHLAKSIPYTMAFESLGTAAVDELGSCSLVIAAGVDALTLVRIARWRDSLDPFPPLLLAWTEEFACAGHAMLVAPGLTAETFLDDKRRPKINVTSQWPKASAATVVPAGCGSAFQPYTATDMLGTVQVTTRLALDVLLNGAAAPVHRMWLGDRRVPEQHGAAIKDTFDSAFREIETS